MVAQRANYNEFLAIFSRNGSRIKTKNWQYFQGMVLEFEKTG